MAGLKISADQRTFSKDGKPFFWLADTLWSAFTNMTDQELDSYLTLRAQEGFNVLQINILPQWDRCWTPAPYMPFPLKEDGMFDYTAPFNQEYFDHAAHICEKIAERGFVPALAVLWGNYVPDTWASGMVSGNIMPKDLIPAYCEKVAETFSRFDPVFVISGDTDLEHESTVSYYTLAMQKLRRLCPDALQTLHIKGRYTYLPDEIVSGMDFYMYQSGHNSSYPEKCYTMAQEMSEKYPLKPIINAEPCYEQMGYSGNQYGRFTTRDVRRAAWMSILSGACAGVTYGAHGVWNWQKLNMPANPVTGEGFDMAKPWTEAMQFPGAWDYGYLKELLAQRRILSLLPVRRIANQVTGLKHETNPDGSEKMIRVSKPNPEIRMAATPDQKYFLIYAPTNTCVKVEGDFTEAIIRTVDLATRRVAEPSVSCRDGITSIEMCPFAEDILVVILVKN